MMVQTSQSGSGQAPGRGGATGIRVFKIVVLGEGGVGKSALTLQFVSHRFLEYHDPTIEDAYQQQAVIDGEAAKLDILDTAGQVEFTAMRDQYMRGGEGFVLCYSITDRRSFEEVQEYRRLISKVRACDDIPLVLVGNKFDLDIQRKVSAEEGEALAGQFGCPFFETSAALRHYVDDAFYALVREIRQRERQKKKKKKKKRGQDAATSAASPASSSSSSSSSPSDTHHQQRHGGATGLQKHSRWRRFRNIFAFIFRRKRTPPLTSSAQ